MKKYVRIFTLLFTMVLMMGSLSSCGKKVITPDTESKFYIYYLEQNRKELYPVEATIDFSLDMGTLVSSVWQNLKVVSENAGYVSAVPTDIELKSYSLDKHDLILNFSSEYNSLSFTVELLFRSALVKTYAQFPEVTTVEIRVDNQPLTLADGTVVGPQKGSHYVEVMGNGLNAYQEAEVTLYFPSANGEYLVPEKRVINYNTTHLLEQTVMSLLLQGSQSDLATINPFPSETKIISISMKNNVCHVNLNDTIMTETIPVSPSLLVYSIVNTLTELPNVSSVQISVNGSSAIMYMNEIPFDMPLERNLDYLNVLMEETESEEENSEN